ncbi:uncharacterized protein LOC121831792 [Peromyscus maniculatus bairdii]|uniref:uncharacterized protein LOC121831792 n=1 Tax=Peromyscus maniculatus bairdii TaxID=230844 RepID=UPI003FCF2988
MPPSSPPLSGETWHHLVHPFSALLLGVPLLSSMKPRGRGSSPDGMAHPAPPSSSPGTCIPMPPSCLSSTPTGGLSPSQSHPLPASGLLLRPSRRHCRCSSRRPGGNKSEQRREVADLPSSLLPVCSALLLWSPPLSSTAAAPPPPLARLLPLPDSPREPRARPRVTWVTGPGTTRAPSLPFLTRTSWRGTPFLCPRPLPPNGHRGILAETWRGSPQLWEGLPLLLPLPLLPPLPPSDKPHQYLQ